jgi:hypothetical protein
MHLRPVAIPGPILGRLAQTIYQSWPGSAVEGSLHEGSCASRWRQALVLPMSRRRTETHPGESLLNLCRRLSSLIS